MGARGLRCMLCDAGDALMQQAGVQGRPGRPRLMGEQ